MKKLSGGRRLWTLCLALVVLSCIQKNSDDHEGRVIAHLTNMPTYQHLRDTFEIDDDKDIHVSAVGEIIFNLSDDEKKYYLANDDIEIFLGDSNSTRSPKAFVFNYRDTLVRFNPNLSFSEKSFPGGYQHVSEIRISWKELHEIPREGLTIPFDLHAGDNDDGLVQKTKLSWNSETDLLSGGEMGRMLLLMPESAASNQPNSFPAAYMYSAPSIDGMVDEAWLLHDEISVSKIVYGFIKDKYDLNVTARAGWDFENLYLLIEINDSRRKMITQKKVSEREIFVDYGWIDDIKGKKIWMMQASKSVWAGGAFKNQKIDSTIRLRKGKYVLNYVSDESHSFSDWTDSPPTTPFYGIVLYEKE